MFGLERCSTAQFGYSGQTSLVLVLTRRPTRCNYGKDSNQQQDSSVTVPKKSSSAASSLIKSVKAKKAELRENKASWRTQKIKTAEVAADITSPQRLWNAGLVWVNFVAALWATWVQRNEADFNEVEVKPIRKKPVYWMTGTPSTKGFISIVVDATFVPEEHRKAGEWGAAVAWVAEKTSHSDQPSIQGSKPIEADSSLQAECYAIRNGITEAAKLYKNVIIKSDCLGVVGTLNYPKRAPKSILPIILDIRKVAFKLHSCICIWVLRDNVYKAHDLAVLTRKESSSIIAE